MNLVVAILYSFIVFTKLTITVVFPDPDGPIKLIIGGNFFSNLNHNICENFVLTLKRCINWFYIFDIANLQKNFGTYILMRNTLNVDICVKDFKEKS